MKVEVGRGKGTLGGSTPVVIKDKEGLLYGWRNLERAKASPETHTLIILEAVDLDVYMGWLQANYPDNAVLLAVKAWGKEHKAIGTEQLRALDREFELSEAQAREIAKLQRDLDTGAIDAWRLEQGEGPLPER
jgi:hypothetical protein